MTDGELKADLTAHGWWSLPHTEREAEWKAILGLGANTIHGSIWRLWAGFYVVQAEADGLLMRRSVATPDEVIPAWRALHAASLRVLAGPDQ